MALPIIAAISSVITSWLSIKKAKNENTARLLESKESHNHAWEMESLTHNPASLRFFSFGLFSTPIIITVISPEHGAKIWANLEHVPDNFMTIFMIMIASIWGASEAKNLILKTRK